MNLNPTALLSLIGELFEQVARLTEENAELRKVLAERQPEPDPQA